MQQSTLFANAFSMQMPLVAIRIGTLLSGQAKWFMLEFVNGINYPKFAFEP